MEDLTEYLKDTSIGTAAQLTAVLNDTAPYTGAWGILEPITEKDIRCFLPAWLRSSAYRNFRIPKKSGGFRLITAPTGRLKEIQSVLNVILQTFFTPSPHTFGFVAGRNIRDNAAVHAAQTCVYNLDLKNFFPSITRPMLEEALRRELPDHLISHEAIRLIGALCTLGRDDDIEALPQGAPTSPVCSNIVMKRLDDRLASIAAKAGMRYSRYADDITFSHSLSPRRMQTHCRDIIHAAIEDYGLTINEAKTRTFAPGCRMEVTGLTVNVGPNVARTFVKQLRTLLHLWEKYGYSGAQAIYSRDFQPDADKELRNVIRGKINYLEMVKGSGDPTLLRLRSRYRRLKMKDKRTLISS